MLDAIRARALALTIGALGCSLIFIFALPAPLLQKGPGRANLARRADGTVSVQSGNFQKRTRKAGALFEKMFACSLAGDTGLGYGPRLANDAMASAHAAGVTRAGHIRFYGIEPRLTGWAWLKAIHPAGLQLPLLAWRPFLEAAADQPGQVIHGALTHLWASIEEYAVQSDPAQQWFAIARLAGMNSISATPVFIPVNGYGGGWLTLLLGGGASILFAAAVWRAARKSEVTLARIRAAVDSLSSAVCLWSARGEPCYVNTAFLQMFGEPDPKDPLRIVAGERVTRRAMDALHQKRSFSTEIRAQLTDGRTRDLLLQAHCITGPGGEELGWIADLADISERKQIEQAIAAARDAALEASRLKSAFLANLSHEIRTPLNGVTGMLKLLGMTDLDAEQSEYVALAESSSEALMTVINDILDFSKIEAGKVDIEPCDFDLRPVLLQVGKVMGLPAKSKGIRVTVEISGDVPSTIHADCGRLRQVILNMMSNAIKFTAKGSVVLRATSPGGRLRIEVADTGIGIAPETVSRLFTPFMQADASTSRRFGGTGLGLAISRELVELMGGQIGVRSAPGKGSTFWFELPNWGDTHSERADFASAG